MCYNPVTRDTETLPNLVSSRDECREESIKQHHLPTAADKILVYSEPTVGCHWKLQEIGMVATLA